MARLSCTKDQDQRHHRRRASITAHALQASRLRGASRAASLVRRSLLAEDSRIEFANLQIGFQLAYYRVRLFRLKAGGKGINVDTLRKAGGLLQRPVSHCLRCCSLPCTFDPPSFPLFPRRHRPSSSCFLKMLNAISEC